MASLPAGGSPPEHNPATQFELQWDILSSLYQSLYGTACGAETEKELRTTLKSLQSNRIGEALRETFSPEKLNTYRNLIEDDYSGMRSINLERMESLVTLADENLRRAVLESLFLFDVNPSGSDTLTLEETTGYDEQGKPLMETHNFKVFTSGALHGIMERDRFLPETLLHGPESMDVMLKEDYPHLEKPPPREDNAPIIALTTIGSLGGIGHKPDSDMDAQVIVRTEPRCKHPWNDADFLVALLLLVLEEARRETLENIMPEEERAELVQNTREALREKCGEGMSEEEIQVLYAVFPGSYQYLLDEHIDSRIHRFSMERQTSLFKKVLTRILPDFPDLEPFSDMLVVFFPFLKEVRGDAFQEEYFPSLKALAGGDGLRKRLVWFYQEYVLGKHHAESLREQIDSKTHQPHSADEGGEEKLFVDHLKSSPKLEETLKRFLSWIAGRSGHAKRNQLNRVLREMQTLFPGTRNILGAQLLKQLKREAISDFRESMCRLIRVRRNFHSRGLEAETEHALQLKILAVEQFLTRKYPETEVHYFLNILRRMRSGDHTPFLVSPEGSQAYSLMLNDFLLNPATMLAGKTPMPFDLPEAFRTMATVGVFSGDSWTFANPCPEEPERKIALHEMPDWGHSHLSRGFFLKHVIPIFLRESEKVSHRNLPKALLNCWWVEMLLLLDAPGQPLTSMTRLLLHPEQRKFVSGDADAAYVREIITLEDAFPQLRLDPWWLKFTEMLTRFGDPTICRQMVFCFAQHVRLSDIIDFETDARLVYIDKDANWRTKVMGEFFLSFFPEHKQRMLLMRFAQGRDDVANVLEKQLKQLFLASMKRVEKRLCEQGEREALKRVSDYLKRISVDTEHKKISAEFLQPMIHRAFQRVPIEDREVLKKMKRKEPLNAMEKIQARSIYHDHQQLKEVSKQILSHFPEVSASSIVLENLVLNSRIRVAGDVLENVIFKHHFERNFERKPFQIPLPISKNLSIPRPLILIRYQVKSERWMFLAMLSKRAGAGGGSQGNMLEMFEDHLVEGIARCVFSGYIGENARTLTAFQKDASRFPSRVSNNPFAQDDVHHLAQSISRFFAPMRLLPREVLEHIHYVRDLFMVCNVNRFLVVSLIVRDNLGEIFVVDFDLGTIRLKSKEHEVSGEQHQAIGVFFDRLRSRKARELLRESLHQLHIPIDPDRPPRFGSWINTRNFDIRLAPKYHRIYLEGILSAIFPATGEYAPWEEYPRPLVKSLDQLGKDAIDVHHHQVQEKVKLRDRELRKVQRASREYMRKVEAERAERLKDL